MTNEIQFTPIVHAFASAEAGLLVNGYLIETSNHVVAVDSALIESASIELRRKFESLGKPLAFVLITHGHPDHYNGLTQLTAGMNVDIIATPGTDRVIRESDALKEKQWSGMFGDESFPANQERKNMSSVKTKKEKLSPEQREELLSAGLDFQDL